MTQKTSTDDPYRWLEDVGGRDALDWVNERNAETLSRLTGSARFERLNDEILQVLNSEERIPYVSRQGDLLASPAIPGSRANGRFRYSSSVVRRHTTGPTMMTGYGGFEVALTLPPAHVVRAAPALVEFGQQRAPRYRTLGPAGVFDRHPSRQPLLRRWLAVCVPDPGVA